MADRENTNSNERNDNQDKINSSQRKGGDDSDDGLGKNGPSGIDGTQFKSD